MDDKRQNSGAPGPIAAAARRRGAWLAALFSAAALVVNGGLVVVTVERMRAASARIARAHEVLEDLQQLLAALVDAESVQRGYLLTGAPEYLEPWRGAEEAALGRLAVLETRTRDQPELRARTAELRPLVQAQLAELERAVALRGRPDGAAAARAQVETGVGQRAMDALRSRLAALVVSQRALIAERTEAAQAAARATVAAHLAAVAVALILLGAAVLLARSRERALRRAQAHLQRFEVVARHSRDIVLLIRRHDGRILEANAAAEAAYGHPAEALRRMTVHDLRAPETQALTAGQMQAADRGGLLFETVHRRRDGSLFPVEVSSQGATVAGERTLVSIVRDTTARREAEAERRRTERALRESEARLRQLSEALPQLVWTADADGMVSSFNQRWRDYTGQAMGEEAWDPALHPDDRAMVLERWREAVAGRRPFELEHRLRRADGGYRWFLRRAVLLQGEDGGAPRWFGTCTDIHALKLSQEALREADRLKEDFLSMASHELRTPLTSLRLQAQLLARSLRAAALPDHRAEHQLARVNAQLDRLEALVALLLDVSRIHAGRLELRRTEEDLAQIAREVLHRFGDEAERAGVVLQLRAAPVVGSWDRARLDQLLTNLVSNAVKYGARRPVEIEVAARGGAAVLAVRDHGIGLAPAARARLFERFTRGENAAGIQGLGLGLWIARQMARAHGGDVTAADTEGGGTTFTVVLPIVAPAREAADPAGAPA